eukprot:6239923-Alexandrium_andersonii.AAC.1
MARSPRTLEPQSCTAGRQRRPVRRPVLHAGGVGFRFSPIPSRGEGCLASRAGLLGPPPPPP